MIEFLNVGLDDCLAYTWLSYDQTVKLFTANVETNFSRIIFPEISKKRIYSDFLSDIR